VADQGGAGGARTEVAASARVAIDDEVPGGPPAPPRATGGRRWRWAATLGRHPARFALVAALVFGTLVALLTPPLRGSDERDHFTRAYAISRGELFVSTQGELVGTSLPADLPGQLDGMVAEVFVSEDHTAFLDLYEVPAPSGEPTFVSGGLTGSYPPGGYLPHVVALGIGRLADAPLVGLVHAARLGGVVAYAALLALAVARMPVHRWVLAIGGLLPVAVNQAATVSADPMVTALTFLVVAIALRLSVDAEADRRRLAVEALVAVGVLALCKPPYLVVALLFVIPAVRHRRSLAAPLAGGLAGAGVLSALWLRYQSANSMRLDLPGLTLMSEIPDYYAYRGIDSGAQTRDLLSRPWDFVPILWETLAYEGWRLPTDMVGLMGSYAVPGVVLAAFVVLFGLACVVPDSPGGLRLGWIERVGLLSVSTAVALGIAAVIYTRVNQHGAPRIDQLTARYFIALVPLVVIAVLPSSRPPGPRTLAMGAVVAAGTVGLLAVVTTGIVGFYYR
jgi:hypothetical protein